MSNSAWDEQIVIKGSGIAEGTYVAQLTEIIRENKIVQNRNGFGGKQIVQKEYDSLTADQKAFVDSAPAEYWPLGPKDKSPREKAAFVDQYRFVFKVPDQNNYEIKSGAEFPINLWGADGTTRIGGGKSLTDFITRATGIPVEVGDEFKLSDFFKPNDEFVISVIKDKGGYSRIDPKSIVKKELAKPVVKGVDALSERAKNLLAYLKANFQGRPKRDILELYGSGQFGSYQETTAAWQEIMKNVKYTSDGKTLDFSEA